VDKSWNAHFISLDGQDPQFFISLQVFGDYGPTTNTISKMKHFILLYGHLSLDSLDNIEIGTV
jgi:hypothetical protein